MTQEPAKGVDRDSPLWKSLQELTNGLGVQQVDLYKSEALIPELCRLWHINFEDDSPGVVRRKVNWQIKRLVDRLLSGPRRVVISVCFNLEDPNGVTVPGNLTERIKRLGQQPSLGGREPDKGPSESTVRRYLVEALDALWLELHRNPPPPAPEEAISPLRSADGSGSGTSGEKQDNIQVEHRIEYVSLDGAPNTSAPLTKDVGPENGDDVNALTRYRNKRYLLPVAGGLALVMALALVTLWPESKEPPSRSGSAAGARTSNDLEATLLSATTPINLSVAFSSSQKQTFEKLVAQAKQSADPLQADTVIAAGGFATELVATVEVEGKSDREVTIYNVRPTNIKRLPVASAALMSSSGANPSTPVSMRFVLDEPSPQAREWAVGEPTDPRGALPFFQTQRLGVAKRQKQTIVVGFNAFWKSFEFTLMIYYEVGGQKYERTVVGDDGKPYLFRVSARACPRKPRSDWEAKLLTEQKDLQRYNEVWEMRPPDWKFQQITSAEYCARFSE